MFVVFSFGQVGLVRTPACMDLFNEVGCCFERFLSSSSSSSSSSSLRRRHQRRQILPAGRSRATCVATSTSIPLASRGPSWRVLVEGRTLPALLTTPPFFSIGKKFYCQVGLKHQQLAAAAQVESGCRGVPADAHQGRPGMQSEGKQRRLAERLADFYQAMRG